MKFGSFNFAKANVLLKEKHLDRHLYEMIPNAWKDPIIPPEIPPKQVRARNGRRETMARIKCEPKNIKPIIGGALTRRMSLAIDALLTSGDDDATEYTAFDQKPDHEGMLDIKPIPKATTTFSTSKFLNNQKGTVDFHVIYCMLKERLGTKVLQKPVFSSTNRSIESEFIGKFS